MKSEMPEGTVFVHYACPSCRWQPILPRATGTLWCLFCGETTLMTPLRAATREEYETQGPSVVIGTRR